MSRIPEQQLKNLNEEVQNSYLKMISSNNAWGFSFIALGVVSYFICVSAGVEPVVSGILASPLILRGVFYQGLATIGRYFALLAKNLSPVPNSLGSVTVSGSALVASNERISEQLTRSEYQDWVNAGRPDLHSWENTGFPDFRSWLASDK